MFLLRTILALLITLSLTMAPFGAAMAQAHALQELPATAAGMDDCAKMMGHQGDHSGGKNNAPCCDTKGVCTAELCLTKCFKVFSAMLTPAALPAVVAIVLSARDPVRPPDWSSGPQPPPPRA